MRILRTLKEKEEQHRSVMKKKQQLVDALKHRFSTKVRRLSFTLPAYRALAFCWEVARASEGAAARSCGRFVCRNAPSKSYANFN